MSPPKTAGRGKVGLWIHGSSGRMGREIQRALETGSTSAGNFQLIGGSAERFEGALFHQGQLVTKDLLASCLKRGEVGLTLDFTTDAGNELLLQAMQTAPTPGTAVLIGTTGLDEARLKRWKTLTEAKRIRTLIAPNTSIGILLLVRAALSTSSVLTQLGFDIEIVETHHRHKKDAPSGTARFIADTLTKGLVGHESVFHREGPRGPGEIGVHAVRGGAVFGEHEVRLLGEAEEICISHRAFSRALFASGALVLGDWLVQQEPGFYSLLDIRLEDLAGVGART